MSGATGWGVIGTGDYVANHVAPALAAAPAARFVGVHSRDRERGARFARAHGAERSFESLAEMLADPEIAAVHVCSPNHLHADQTILAAEAGKHVLCEKPMSLTIGDCERMIAACSANGVRLGVGFENRHHPAHHELRRLVAAGALGAVPVATVQYSRWLKVSIGGWRADPALSGGGALMGLGVHCLDLVRFVLGAEAEEVVAFTDERSSGRPVDELVLALVRFSNGTFCQVVSGINVPRSHNDVVLYGERARAESIGALGMYLQGALEIVTEDGTTRTEYPADDVGTLVLQVEAFHESIAAGTEPNASGEDGRRMVMLTDALLASARDGRAVAVGT